MICILAATLTFGAADVPSSLVREVIRDGRHVVSQSFRLVFSPVSALGRTGEQSEQRAPEDSGPYAVSAVRLLDLPHDRGLADRLSQGTTFYHRSSGALHLRFQDVFQRFAHRSLEELLVVGQQPPQLRRPLLVTL